MEINKLADECIPLTVTSPPFDDMRVFGGHPFDFDSIAKELFRTTMPGGVVAGTSENNARTEAKAELRASNGCSFGTLALPFITP